MARVQKKAKGKKSFSIFDDEEAQEAAQDEGLPKDEAGRLKIKRQYEDLLGIRIDKLKGRVLNRERINKTIEGVYFICVDCRNICHNIDDGFVEDPDNAANRCRACATERGIPVPPTGKGKAAA